MPPAWLRAVGGALVAWPFSPPAEGFNRGATTTPPIYRSVFCVPVLPFLAKFRHLQKKSLFSLNVATQCIFTLLHKQARYYA
jgi:hypothetical protein